MISYALCLLKNFHKREAIWFFLDVLTNSDKTIHQKLFGTNEKVGCFEYCVNLLVYFLSIMISQFFFLGYGNTANNIHFI